jgi:hypothetical protein
MNNVLYCLRCIYRKIENINSFRINNKLIYLLPVATHGHTPSSFIMTKGQSFVLETVLLSFRTEGHDIAVFMILF